MQNDLYFAIMIKELQLVFIQSNDKLIRLND
jgi:hypothetical protein